MGSPANRHGQAKLERSEYITTTTLVSFHTSEVMEHKQMHVSHGLMCHNVFSYYQNTTMNRLDKTSSKHTRVVNLFRGVYPVMMYLVAINGSSDASGMISQGKRQKATYAPDCPLVPPTQNIHQKAVLSHEPAAICRRKMSTGKSHNNSLHICI